MNSGTLGSERRRAMWLGTATMAVVTILAAVARKKAGADAAAVAGGIYVFGVLAIAWLTARITPYPRWSWFASAGVVSTALVVAAVAFTSPAQVKTWTATAWMMPWLFLIFTLSPQPKAGWCAPSSVWSGPVMIGVSVIYSAILLVSCWLTR